MVPVARLIHRRVFTRLGEFWVSDRLLELVEYCGKSEVGLSIHCKFVVASAQVLEQGM